MEVHDEGEKKRASSILQRRTFHSREGSEKGICGQGLVTLVVAELGKIVGRSEQSAEPHGEKKKTVKRRGTLAVARGEFGGGGGRPADPGGLPCLENACGS